MGEIAIAGGGICGLAASMMLADDGHHVTVFERDDAPTPPGPAEFEPATVDDLSQSKRFRLPSVESIEEVFDRVSGVHFGHRRTLLN